MKKMFTFRSLIHSILFFTVSISLFSCISMSTMQTARTTPKGEGGVGIALGFISTDFAMGSLDTAEITAPILEIGGRFGIADNWDAGARISIIGTSVIDTKYQLIGDHESLFAASVGLGLGYLKITQDETVSKIFDINVPVYLSLHPTPWFSLYACPKYVFRINSYSNAEESGSSNSSWYGATTGIRLGKKVGFNLEYSTFRNSETDLPFSQVTGGVTINF